LDQPAVATSAARSIGLQIQIMNTATIGEINAVFATLARERPDALLIAPAILGNSVAKIDGASLSHPF
jgi:hypothetical protein